MKREYYSDSIDSFLKTDPKTILGKLASKNEFSLEQTQRYAWEEEITILHKILLHYKGHIYFEYSIPRMGQRIDVVILINHVIFVLEFKIGEKEFQSHAIEQVWDYALDLKNFHESSHNYFIAPILVATNAHSVDFSVTTTSQNDKLLFPINSNVETLCEVIKSVLLFTDGETINHSQWECGRYCPTPTIIEAAMALYNRHSVDDISRRDASAINIAQTSKAISDVIKESRERGQKTICFVTGVPGSGKTLVGLNIATTHINKSNDLYSVFLSGNGPLVKILREALVRDKVSREKERGKKIKKGEVYSEVKAFIQYIHNFRDDCLVDPLPPIEHVALFDEAQRAWNLEHTSSWMRRQKNNPNFNISEPEFLMSCLDRHEDWAVIVCLVGGGQEINTGEAGISEWIESLNRSFPDWNVYLSSRLTDSEYGAGKVLDKLATHPNVMYNDDLHLSVSLRSFRAEHVSLLIKQMLDLDIEGACSTLGKINKYPIVITRDLTKAKQWLKKQARGSERYGIVVSSQAERLKPHAIDVKSPMNPIHWFLNSKDDVRSSYFLEHVATEFDIQGLELDWVCVTWDADFRYSKEGWKHLSFRGNRWTNIRKKDRKNYLKNAYRVLLTRARQGMVIVVPSGDTQDITRSPKFYDDTYQYLKDIGFSEI
ncbi:DNA/RNA helicase domain-containing protein [Planctomycetota bacterium]